MGVTLEAPLRNVITTVNAQHGKINYNDAYMKAKQFNTELEQEEMKTYMIMNLLGYFVPIYNSDNLKIGLYFQDAYMKMLYAKFSDVMFLDGKYKLTTKSYTIFILSIINSELKTEPVLIFASKAECYETISYFFDTFKQENDMMLPRLILTDKDLTERKILRNYFPLSSLRLCYFHICQAFKRKFTTLKMSKKARKQEMKLIKILFTCNNENAYDEVLEKLNPIVKEYYNENWGGIKSECVSFFMYNMHDYSSKTNNRAEGLNSMIKHKFKRKLKIKIFFTRLYKMLNLQRREKNYDTIRAYLKSSRQFSGQEDIKLLENSLTRVSALMFAKKTCNDEDIEYKEDCRLYCVYGIICHTCYLKFNLDIYDFLKLTPARWTKAHFIKEQDFPIIDITFDSYSRNELMKEKKILSNHNEKDVEVILKRRDEVLNTRIDSTKFYSISAMETNYSAIDNLKKPKKNQNFIKILTDKIKHLLLDNKEKREVKKAFLDNIIDKLENNDISITK